ncbi:uncharacterized protein LOC134767175 [Penaeus indicus]|uniref:uncharacterized protein LOC134767175 n=1 Tax=Penaeus indicus TaxID=29960 RepID=UPI00300C4AF5
MTAEQRHRSTLKRPECDRREVQITEDETDCQAVMELCMPARSTKTKAKRTSKRDQARPTKQDPPRLTNTNQNPPTPSKTHQHQPTPTNTNQHPPTPTKTHQHQPTPTNTNQDPPTPTNTHQHPPKPTDTHQHQPKPTETHQHQPNTQQHPPRPKPTKPLADDQPRPPQHHLKGHNSKVFLVPARRVL